MKANAKTAWGGVALAAAATATFFLATNKGRLFKKFQASLQALLGGQAPPAAAPTPTAVPKLATTSQGRTPTPENGHVRDVIASNPPKPETGSNFTPQGDVHQPQH
ncbi:hypothetical protein GO988_01635 [Hymenobacter sp. HMF4947]|uniref:Uncharacterized protein n=1 Tax=Hymenobacter ginkgonis TaxID=2682976 RepID=A0A7K1TA17_9BACT|nr:hypothetical protein [Hymenobacter ginkgonis]MVN75021.1 hypothetical protein [Hymenobacter ginkgonis]